MTTVPTDPALFDPPYAPAAAVFSPCGKYRYRLTRRWAADGPVCVFVMLNPSTAGVEDDPTVRRCVGFARRLGCSALRVVNLYALRSTDPDRLWLADDPVGPDNDDHLRSAATIAARTGGHLIAAWGAHARTDRVRGVVDEVCPGAQWDCLGTTNAGAPRHPLYLRRDARRRAWGHQ